LRLFIHQEFVAAGDSGLAFLAQLDQFLVIAFWVWSILGVVFFLVFVYQFFFPLGVLMENGKLMRDGGYQKHESVPISESLGEWYMLELILLKMNKDLKRRKADAVRERGEVDAIVSAANAAILAVDENQHLRYMNEPMAELLDHREEDLLGRPLQAVLRRGEIIGAFEKALGTRKTQRVEASYQMLNDSSTRFFDISVTPLKEDRKGRGHGAIAIFHDITERKRIEKVRMDFVANASHELKTPLTAVHGYMDILKNEGGLPGNMTDMAFLGVDKNLKRLNQLVSDLLHLTKIEGADPVEKLEVLTEDVTESILHELKPLWTQKNHKVKTVYLASQVFAYREYLEQILINLVGNSIKYCDRPAEIHLTWRSAEGGVVLSVKDNGPGIESYHLGRLFERFYRVRDHQDVQNINGTGLGLAIVRHAMLKQGGKVDVKSAPGLGTEFLCFFPNPSSEPSSERP